MKFYELNPNTMYKETKTNTIFCIDTLLNQILIIEEFGEVCPKWVKYENDSIKDLFALNFEEYEYTKEYFEKIVGMDVLNEEIEHIIKTVSDSPIIGKHFQFTFDREDVRRYVIENAQLSYIYDKLKETYPTLDFKIAYGNTSLSIIVTKA